VLSVLQKEINVKNFLVLQEGILWYDAPYYTIVLAEQGWSMFWKEKRDSRKRMKVLRAEISRVEGFYSKQYDRKNEDDAFEMYRLVRDETFEEGRELTLLEERSIRIQAKQMGIDLLPEWTEREEPAKGFGVGYSYLTESGKARLQEQINQKLRERWEWRVKIAVLIATAITGLIGALTGLIAIARK